MLLISNPVVEGLFSLGTGAVSGIAGLFGADAQSRNVRKTNATNLRIAQEANSTQQQIARENNEMQLAAMRENNAFNKQSAIDMFNMEAAYNSPSAVKARLLEAGINPATLYGQGGSVGGSVNASTPSASSSGISPSMPSMSVPSLQTEPSLLNTMFGNIESITRSIGNLAKSGLDKMQRKQIGATLQAQLDKIIEDTKGVEIQNQWNMFKKNIDIAYLGRKTEQDIQKLMSDVFKSYAEGGSAHTAMALHEAQEKLTSEQFKQLREQAPWLLENIKKLGALYDEQKQTEQSKQAVNYSQTAHNRAMARLTNEQASQLEQSHDANVRLNTILAGKEALDFNFLDAVAEYRKNLLFNESELSGKRIDELEEMIKRAKKENNLYYWRFLFERLDKTAQDVGYLLPFKASPTSMPNNPYWQSSSQ